jgi:hypothetical protein
LTRANSWTRVSSKSCDYSPTPRWIAPRRSPCCSSVNRVCARNFVWGVLGLDQRVTLRYALPPMGAEETSSVNGHLKFPIDGHETSPGTDTLFSDDALSNIHQAGRGLPRAVNNLARQALVAAYANRSAIVDEKAARQAITEMDAD